jgi:hypothetical protein
MNSKKLISVTLFAIAMAYIEAAVVVYLRNLYGIEDLVLDLMPFDPHIALTEFCREIATLILLLSIGWTAGRKFQDRLGFTFFAFGMWDIFYYVWLRVLINWPATLMDMDLLFLIPLPWWGPVIAPVLIACLMVVWGTLVVIKTDKGLKVRMRWWELAGMLTGVLILLYTFMEDAIHALPATREQLNALSPTNLNWPIYFCGLFITSFCLLFNFFRKSIEK